MSRLRSNSKQIELSLFNQYSVFVDTCPPLPLPPPPHHHHSHNRKLPSPRLRPRPQTHRARPPLNHNSTQPRPLPLPPLPHHIHHRTVHNQSCNRCHSHREKWYCSSFLACVGSLPAAIKQRWLVYENLATCRWSYGGRPEDLRPLFWDFISRALTPEQAQRISVEQYARSGVGARLGSHLGGSR